MSDLSLFQQALQEYQAKQVKPKVVQEQLDLCEHHDVIDDNGIVTCMDCGEELERRIMHEQEWRNYGASDGKIVSDPSRVQQRKIEERSIHRDIENLGFSDIVVDKADHLYKEVTGGQIYRGGCRRSIIFACVFYAYRILGTPQNHDDLISVMGLSRRTGHKGIKFVNLNAPKDSEIHTADVTQATLVKDLMGRFSAHPMQIEEVVKLYEKVENRSSKLNQARPQSVTAGIVYYWICLKKIDIGVKEFAKIAGLSVLTINKIAKEISDVLNTPEII